MHERFSLGQGLSGSRKKLKSGADCPRPPIQGNLDISDTIINRNSLQIKNVTAQQGPNNSQLDKEIIKNNCCDLAENIYLAQNETINICSSIEEITERFANDVMCNASFHIPGIADSLSPCRAQSVVNNEHKFNAPTSPPVATESIKLMTVSQKGICDVMAHKQADEKETEYNSINDSTVKENIFREEFSFAIPRTCESIMQINENFVHQLFTPLSFGDKNNGLKTYIQLDSGATTNLMGVKMADMLGSRNFINFIYPTFRAYLTDVQNQEIIQPRKPINVTLFFRNVSINACFHIVENLEFPLLGLETMLENDISILNENRDSYLVIGNVSHPREVIKNVNSVQEDVFNINHECLQPGINLIRCKTVFPFGTIYVGNCDESESSCLSISPQIRFVNDNEFEITVKNSSGNCCELFPDTPLTNASINIINNVFSCNSVSESLIAKEEEEGRFKFPLSESEGEKLLNSVEPFSLPLLGDGEEEEIIDWKAEVSKEGVFPPHLLDEFISFIETEVPHIFSRTEYDCGKLDRKYGYIEDIPLTTDRPIASPQMNVGPIRSAQIRSTFDKLEAAGIVEKGLSPYATPCFVVPKLSSNKTRLVMDFRELNKHCHTVKQPVMRIDLLYQDVSNGQPIVYSLVDVCSAFHALELGELAMIKCAVITSDCQYLPKRALFGYKNAPAIFIQAMVNVFAELPREPDGRPFCRFYFDDIIIFSKSEEDHLRHIKIVFRLLYKVGLKIQASKHQFFKPQVELLGKVISGTTISPQKRHIESLQRFPQPTTIKQLQSFLGICTWNCNLVPDYSRVIQPLTKLLRKNEPFVWGEDQENTFQYLKQYFTELTALYFIDYSQPIYVAADASDRFIAGIAYQIKSYSKEEIPKFKESLLHTKEMHKLPPPIHPTNHPLLPKGAIGIPSPFKLTAEGTNSPHDPKKLQKEAQLEGGQIDEVETEDYLEAKDKLHVICNVGYYSSSLSKSQEGYSIIEKEAFAVVCSLEFFKPLLQGAKEVYVLSDSRPFLFIMKMMKCGISRIQRWSLKLFSMPYTIIMVHIKGTVNYSDSLTRVWAVEESNEPKPDMKKAIMVESPFKIGQLITYNDLVEVLEKNPNLVSFTVKEPSTKKGVNPIKNVRASIKYVGSHLVDDAVKMTSLSEIMKHQKTDSFCRGLKESEKYYQFKSVWYKKRPTQIDLNDEGRVIVPRSLVSPLIALFHVENHSGVNNLYDQIKSVYYFPNMRATITEFIKMCHLCAVYKSSTTPKVPVANRDLDPVPKNTVWSFDVIDGFPKFRNSGSILSMVEYYSGYRIVTPLKNTHSSEIARIIEKEIIATFGPPRLMITDGGSNLLRSKNLRKLTHFYGIQSYVTSPYHPASHGRIEVSHQAITMLIKIAGEHLQRPWFDICSFVQIALNSRPSVTLGGHSPMYFMFGIEPTYRLRNNLKLSDIPDIKEQEQIWAAHDEANKIILKEYNKVRNKLNNRLGGKMVEFKKGEFVWARNFTKSPKQKIQTKYLTEPLEVVKDFGYALLAKNHLGVVFKIHKNNVKRYYPRNLELYNALPFKIKLKLGSNFDTKDLHKFYDALTKEEDLIDELVEKETLSNEESKQNVHTELPINEFDSDNESDDDDELRHMLSNVIDKNVEQKTVENSKALGSTVENISPEKRAGAKTPSLPFHMKLRNKVRFRYDK